MLDRLSAIEVCQKFVRECANEGLWLDYAVLFGSYAYGQPHEYSDVDLLLVGPTLTGSRLQDFDTYISVKMKREPGFSDLEIHTAPTEWFLHEERTFIKECVLPVGIFIPTVSAKEWAEIEAGRPYHPSCDIDWKDIDDSPGTGVYDYPDGVPVPVAFPGRAERLERLRRKRERQKSESHFARKQ